MSLELDGVSSKSENNLGTPSPKAEKVRVLQMHGFIDDAGRNRFWPKGIVLDDPSEIAILRQRKVALEPLG